VADLANECILHSFERSGVKSLHRQKIFSSSVCVAFEFKSVKCKLLSIICQHRGMLINNVGSFVERNCLKMFV
jgi:hypothetical protein